MNELATARFARQVGFGLGPEEATPADAVGWASGQLDSAPKVKFLASRAGDELPLPPEVRLLDSQNEYFEATRAYINARYNQATAQARTLAGMGQLVSTLGVPRQDLPSAQDAGQDRAGIDPAELCPLDETMVDTLEKIKKEVVVPSRARAVVPAAAAPAAAKVNLAADALFDFNKSVLKVGGAVKLDELVTKIKGVQLDVVIATGHTDSVGSDAYNQRLSVARAESVKAYLVSKGVPANRIFTDGKGETQPITKPGECKGPATNC